MRKIVMGFVDMLGQCPHSPVNPTTACQEYFELLDYLTAQIALSPTPSHPWVQKIE
jgi:hypothetical protein